MWDLEGMKESRMEISIWGWACNGKRKIGTVEISDAVI